MPVLGDRTTRGFVAAYGTLVQVELDALDPADLHALFDDALRPWWDPAAYDAVLAAEEAERDQFRQPPPPDPENRPS